MAIHTERCGATYLVGNGVRVCPANRSRASYGLSRATAAQEGFGTAEAGGRAAQGDIGRARQLAAKRGPTGRQPATDRRHARQAKHTKACIAASARSCPQTRNAAAVRGALTEQNLLLTLITVIRDVLVRLHGADCYSPRRGMNVSRL